MRILIVDNESGGLAVNSLIFAKYGEVDTVYNFLDAVVSYASACSRGHIHDLVVMHQQPPGAPDATVVIEMLRKYESGFRKSGTRTTICYISDNSQCQRTYESRNGKGGQVHFQRSPANIGALELMAESVASKIEMQKRRDTVRTGLSIQA